MKKLLSALLAATMVFSSVVMSVSAETGITVPDGVTAKQLNVDGTVTIPYTDDAISGEVVREGLSVGCANLNGKAMVYVNAPEAGNYTVQWTGAYTEFDRAMYVNVNGVEQISGDAEIRLVTGYGNSTAENPGAGTAVTLALRKGYNYIQAQAKGYEIDDNQNQQVFTQLTITGPYAAPAGVTPVAVSNATQAVAAVGSTAFSGTVYTNTSAASYGYANGTPIASFNTTNGVYVNAAQAGTYKVYITWCDQFQSRTRDIVVNGVVQQAGVELGGVDGKTPWYHALGRSPEYEITLRQGVNSIIFQPGGKSSGADATQNAWSAITVTGDCYGLPTIDAAANEGDVRLTWQAEDKTSTTPYVGMKNGTITYTMTVNCITAGEYCFIPYLQRGMTSGSEKIKVAVNGTEVATPDGTTAHGNSTGFEYFKGVPVKVTLNAGKNVITVSYSDYWMFLDKFELVNFAVVEPNSTTTGQYPFAQFAYAGFITETTTLAESPKVITKDKISQTIPANVATANVTALFSDFVSETYTRQLVLASYDANGKLLNVKLGAGKGYASYAHQLNISGLDLTGAETVKIMVLDDLTNLTHSSFKEFTK